MTPKVCKNNPYRQCIYGPCFFGGTCHVEAEAQREAVRTGEAEYASWFPSPADTSSPSPQTIPQPTEGSGND